MNRNAFLSIPADAIQSSPALDFRRQSRLLVQPKACRSNTCRYFGRGRGNLCFRGSHLSLINGEPADQQTIVCDKILPCLAKMIASSKDLYDHQSSAVVSPTGISLRGRQTRINPGTCLPRYRCQTDDEPAPAWAVAPVASPRLASPRCSLEKMI